MTWWCNTRKYSSYFLYCFVRLQLLACVLINHTDALTPATNNGTVGSLLGGGDSNKGECEFYKHDLHLELEVPVDLTLYIIGDIQTNGTLVFNSTTKGILEPIHNITVDTENMKNNTNFTLQLLAKSVGHTTLIVEAFPQNMTDTSRAYVRIEVPHSKELDIVSDVVGWMYFVAWSVSFYPQTLSNWQRKSVIGLHFDFLSLNIVGFLVYFIFNISLYSIKYIENLYLKKHPYGVNPVQLNDVIFAAHAFFACSVQVFQCLIYERGDQKVSKTAKSILSGISIVTIVVVTLSLVTVITWLNFLYYLSFVKLFITLIKYIPQAYYNYRRKSTSGWSIGNVLLDFTGGLLSIAQMFILAYNYSDWGSLFGDPTKFGLGLFSIIFDLFFMFQHYILYRGNASYHRVCDSPMPEQISPLTESVASSTDYGSTNLVY